MYTLQSDDALSTLAQTLENIACVVGGIVCVKAKFSCIAVTRSREAERGMGRRRLKGQKLKKKACLEVQRRAVHNLEALAWA